MIVAYSSPTYPNREKKTKNEKQQPNGKLILIFCVSIALIFSQCQSASDRWRLWTLLFQKND